MAGPPRDGADGERHGHRNQVNRETPRIRAAPRDKRTGNASKREQRDVQRQDAKTPDTAQRKSGRRESQPYRNGARVGSAVIVHGQHQQHASDHVLYGALARSRRLPDRTRACLRARESIQPAGKVVRPQAEQHQRGCDGDDQAGKGGSRNAGPPLPPPEPVPGLLIQRQAECDHGDCERETIEARVEREP